MAYKEFKILSVDGGGIKGLFSSTILEHLEDVHNCLVSDYFDMICGTSTGGLIALAASLRNPAKDISEIYIQHGKVIFPHRSKLRGVWLQVAGGGKFSDAPLRKVLEQTFGDRKLAESNNILCIPSYSVTDARPWVFKFDHREGNLRRDNNTSYVDVALATSAAPTYFPMAQISNYDNKQFVDGGVWANNPTMTGLIEALKCFAGEGKDYDRIKILSVSSLAHTGGKRVGIKRNRGFLSWRNELFETAMTGQSFFTDYFMKTVHHVSDVPVDYVRIPSANLSSEQEKIVQLDVASRSALDLIRGKGNDVGYEWAGKPEIMDFFKQQKTYTTNGKL